MNKNIDKSVYFLLPVRAPKNKIMLRFYSYFRNIKCTQKFKCRRAFLKGLNFNFVSNILFAKPERNQKIYTGKVLKFN